MSTNKIISEINAEQMTKEIPGFAPGDTVVCLLYTSDAADE